SLIPIDTHRLLRWRMDTLAGAWGSIRRIAEEEPQLVADTLALVAAQGPVRARDTGIPRRVAQPGQMWNWHSGKRALEYLFFTGRIGATRRVNFERRYDLIERILPAGEAPPKEDAQRELIRISARALGVATEPDLGDYFRLPRADSKARVAELVAAGELTPVDVAGWDAPAYLWPAARRPRRVDARALLSPFDNLIFFRTRTQRLFGFHYRIEIYVPAPKRVYGYYVLPFLLGDELVARVDLKSDRAASTLLVQGAWAEPGVDPAYVASELAEELALVADWLGLDNGVSVAANGDLAPQLCASMGRKG
ncbi:MAG: YcaQ family DNA glycosylase, partial [Solirubrobacterales bacterium]|nr:YcaQ family DNA glycosylase [Solirubrobacterales bacterium]